MEKTIEKTDYENFVVYQKENKYTFIHVNISTDEFYNHLIDYFFSEKKILNYANNTTDMSFKPDERNYVSVFRNIKIFLDSETEEIDINLFKSELSRFLSLEEFRDDELIKFRKDKMGKIGEYILHVILSEYFNFTCIIPKLNLITDRNMSVFGIDTLFYSQEENMIMFGESKVSKNIDAGINAIRTSLKKYEQNIDEEYLLILSKEMYKKVMKVIPEKYEGELERCINFSDFVKESGIKTLGVPLFVLHGECISEELILEKFDGIEETSLFGLDTMYLMISLPVIDIDNFKVNFIENIKRRCSYYDNKIAELRK